MLKHSILIFLSLIMYLNVVQAASPGVDSPHTPNTVLAGPTSGGNAVPTFRSLVAADIGANTITTAAIQASAVNLTSKVTGVLPIANGGTNGATKLAGFDNLSPNTTKGDLIVFDGTNNARLAVGANNLVLVADSTQTTGLKWAAAGTGAAFSGLTGGTNSAAAMVIGTGASLTTSGSGTITANAYNGSANINLTTAVTGILPIANGGTGVTLAATGAAHSVLFQTSVGGNISVATLVEGDLPATTAFTDTANTFTTVQTHANYISLQSSSPAQITADQVAFDVGAASYSRISSNAAWNIQGITGGVNGRVVYLENVGSSNIILSNQNSSATAANRIISPSGADVTMSANYGSILIYDATDARWRIMDIYQIPGGGTSFSTITSGSNTTATLTIGTGATLSPTGSGTLTANAFSGILPAANGGTNNAFTQFAGPSSTTKTFTLPNASANILTDNAAVTLAQGGIGITSGSSGGIPYFSSTSTIASSATLAQYAIVTGGGSGATPVSLGSIGTVTTLLHGNAGGLPTFSAVSLTVDVSGILPVANGGSGVATNTTAYGLLAAGTTATGAIQNAGTGTSGQYYVSNGASSLGTWTTVTPGAVSGTAPIIVTGSAVAFGTTQGPTVADANSSAGVGSATAGKKVEIWQTIVNNTQPAIEVQNSTGNYQWQIDNTVTSNVDVKETLRTSKQGSWQRQSITETVTIANTATSSSATNLLPANATDIVVSYRVTAAITCTTNFSVGDAVSSSRFGSGISKSLSTISSQLKCSPPTAPFGNSSATTILITPDTTPSDSTGRLEITVWYTTYTEPGV